MAITRLYGGSPRGVLGAMELAYQRGVIQDDSLRYERAKHDGSLPIVGVNTFLPRDAGEASQPREVALTRSSREEKEACLARLADFQAHHAAEAPAALARLKAVALAGGNVFEELLSTVEHCSLGQITQALYEVGGAYRRNM